MIDAHCHLQKFENPGEVISGLENIETIIKSVRGIKEGDKVDIIK